MIGLWKAFVKKPCLLVPFKKENHAFLELGGRYNFRKAGVNDEKNS